MRSSTFITAIMAVAPAVMAQNNSTAGAPTLCEKYTMALLNVSNSTNQLYLLTALVNTAVIGNYSKTAKNKVYGILGNGPLANSTKHIDLMGYFNGSFASTDTGGTSGASVNFLDGGGAAPLMMGKAANDESSNQYTLLTHLYQYFGALLGCGAAGFPAYMGDTSQYKVHKFMDLDYDQVSYFVQQVGAAAASFGVSNEDITTVAGVLMKTFGYRCSPPMVVAPANSSAEAQSICVAASCPIDPMGGDCSADPYDNKQIAMPSMKSSMGSASPTSTGSMGGSGSGSGSGTATTDASGPTGAAVANGIGAAVMGVAGLAALAAGL